MKTTVFLQSELHNIKAELLLPEFARFHILPVPHEATVSYGAGTANGPNAILEASNQLELWDNHSIPAEEGIYTHNAVDCSGSSEEVFHKIKEASSAILACSNKAIPIVLGGEHSISYGVLAAMQNKYDELGVIHFDAHADLRYSYENSIYSHASVMHRVLADLHLPLIQFGVRSFSSEELEVRKKYNVLAYDAEFLCNHCSQRLSMNKASADNLLSKQDRSEKMTLDSLIPSDFPKNIYLSFDLDALDPSILPATGTPVPGGLAWYQAINLIKASIANRNVVACDIVELAPCSHSQSSDFTAATLVYNIMGLIQRNG